MAIIVVEIVFTSNRGELLEQLYNKLQMQFNINPFAELKKLPQMEHDALAIWS